MYVALTQTASALPFFVFALPAGAIGDIVDRRKLILYTEFWMVGVATVLAVATIGGFMSPWLLLGLTFALSAGDAIETPTWRAILPELVKKEDLAAASALNGIEFNFARAVGPALAGVIIAAVGVGAAFALNVVSFFGVILLVARWKRPIRRRTTPPETVAGATVAALRYVRFSPSLRGMMLRSGLTMFFASALLALMPSVARGVSDSPTGYGILLGCFGAGAVLGALAMQPARARWSTEAVASGGVAILGLMTVAAGFLHAMTLLAAAMLVAGAAWIVFISLVSALMQSLAPDWVRARVLAVFMLVFQGGLAAGSALWGAVAAQGRHSAGVALGRPRHHRDGGRRTRGEAAGHHHGRESVESLEDAGDRRRHSPRVRRGSRARHGRVPRQRAIGPTSSSRRYTSTAACGAAMVPSGGASTATWRRRIATSKRSSSARGRSICVSTSA